MAADTETSYVASRLRLQMNDLTAKKEESLKAINELNEELKKLYAKAPKRNRESLKEIEDQIAALEFKRTTSSLALADEKAILRQIASLERTKTQVVERKAYEATLQDKKAELSEQRDSLSVTLTAIDELTPVLVKVELANKLGCAPNEMKSITIDYPPERTRHVIGKKGSTVRQISEKYLVAIDVHSVKGKIEITGSQASVESAILEINKITQAVGEELEASPALVAYLSTRRITTLADIRQQHPDVFIDVHRNSMTVHLDGLPEDVAAAKSAVLALDVKQESRYFNAYEAGAVMGKKGANIKQLLDEHSVIIDVDKEADSHKVTVTGPSTDVNAAWKSIDEIVEENKDVTETMNIHPIVCSALLTDGGARIRQLQKDINERTEENGGNVFLGINKDSAEKAILLRGNRTAVDIALQVLEQASKEIMDASVVIQVDPLTTPRIIGKGGSNLKKMRSQGDGVLVEIDTENNFYLFGSNAEDVKAVADLVHHAVEVNQVGRVDVDPSNAKRLYQALVRAKSKEINEIINGMALDEEASQITLRGSTENIKTATDIIIEFIANNYMEDVPFAPEHEFSLLTGGNKCAVNQISKEFDVDMGVVRSNHVVTIRGKKDNVMKAKGRLLLFLNGGDGYSVAKLVVSEQALGAVIGKGGSRRSELEAANEGAKMFIDRKDGIIFIRGPDEKVQKCRVDILKIVSMIRVMEKLPITPEQHGELSKTDVIKRLTNGIPVQVTVANDEVTVRGISSDVKDVLALLKAQLTGIYESCIPLDQEQYAKVSGSCKDTSHFDRIRDSTGAAIELDSSRNSIVIKGKRSNVKKAKIHMMGLLDFLLPLQFDHVKIPKVFQSTVANAASLADVAALSGASVVLDRDMNSIQIQSSDAEKMAEASKIIKAKIAEAEKLMFVISIDKNEAWLISAIIGKGGSQINKLIKETNCRIDVSKQESTVTVTGDDETSVAKARECLDAVIDKARRECAFVELPSAAMPAFFGKGGSHIQSFSKEHGVEVESFRRDSSKVKIAGPEDSVTAARTALLHWIDVWEENHEDVSIQVDKTAIPAIIGGKGAVINVLQKESGCRIDVNRETSMLTIKGGTREKRNELLQKIHEIVSEKEALEKAKRDKERDAVDSAPRKTKPEKGEPTAKTPPTAQSSPADQSRSSRAGEFAAYPIGLTTPGRNRSKRMTDAPLAETASGRKLFGLLVSSSTPHELFKSDSMEPPQRVVLSQSEDCDSASEVTSSANPAESGTRYYTSASGFAVRV